MPRILIICGPTAAGKTAVGVALAKRLNAEIVSADSQQVWRGFDIGTAKPTAAERAEIPHHLIDCADPSETFDAARYCALADEAIAGIASRGKQVIVVGGTGMYLRMLIRGICEAPPRDEGFRAEMEAEIAAGRLPQLHAQLQSIDPVSAAKITPNDPTRIVRALEIFHLTGVPASRLRAQHGFARDRYAARWIGIGLPREELYARIEARVDAMMAAGWLEEARALRDQYGDRVRPFAAVGYRELAAHLRGELALAEAANLIKQNTRRLAKRQLTWFGAEPGIEWFSPETAAAIG